MTTNHTPTRVALNDAYDAIVDVNAALTARVAALEAALRLCLPFIEADLVADRRNGMPHNPASPMADAAKQARNALGVA